MQIGELEEWQLTDQKKIQGSNIFTYKHIPRHINPESQQDDEKLIEELSKLHLLQEDISTEQSLELNQRSFFERYEI